MSNNSNSSTANHPMKKVLCCAGQVLLVSKHVHQLTQSSKQMYNFEELVITEIWSRLVVPIMPSMRRVVSVY